MGYVGGYSLDLYCDGPNHHSLCDIPQFSGQTFAQAAREARKAGWKVSKRGEGRECGYALCPECRKKRSKISSVHSE